MTITGASLGPRAGMLDSVSAKGRLSGLSGEMVGVLAIGPKVRGFKPGRGRWIFKGDKNLQQAFLRRGSKAVGPIS
jgi:hypothetical protein